jgi:hypothetical protein
MTFFIDAPRNRAGLLRSVRKLRINVNFSLITFRNDAGARHEERDALRARLGCRRARELPLRIG